MDNDEARASLVAKRDAINSALDALSEYVQQVVDEPNWTSAAVKARKMAAVKARASSGGIDLSSWTGKAAPKTLVETPE